MFKIGDYVEVKMTKCISKYELSLIIEEIGGYMGMKGFIKEIIDDGELDVTYKLDITDDMTFYEDELVEVPKDSNYERNEEYYNIALKRINDME